MSPRNCIFDKGKWHRIYQRKAEPQTTAFSHEASTDN